MRESGLKLRIQKILTHKCYVSLHAREWIEILYSFTSNSHICVSLHAREWIEIIIHLYVYPQTVVSLHAREWIEIKDPKVKNWREYCLSPCERVD